MKDKIKKLKQMYKISGYHKQFVILFLIIELTAIVEIVTIPYITKQMIDIEIPDKNIKALIILGNIYVVFLLLQCYMTLKHCNMRSILKRKIQGDLREKVFNKMQDVKTKFYDENETGVILQFLNTDVNDASLLFPEIIVEMYFMGIIRFTIIAIFLMFVNLKITLGILALYFIGLLITTYFNKKTIKNINEIRKINIELYNYINEGIQGFLTIKILNIIKNKEKELNDKLEEYNKSNNKLEKIIAKYNNIFAFITSLQTAIIIYFAGINVIQGSMAYVEILLLINYSSALEYELKWFTKHLTNFNKSFFAYSKILDFLNLNNIENLENGEELKKINSIEFKNVYFSYNGNQKNIENFSLELNKNEKVALIGKTGSGKTTVVNLLCRFYEPINGEILINNRDYKCFSISSIRKRIGYVMQEVQILPNTIIDNIRYANENISLEQIENIFKKLKLHNKIMQLENGYNTDIYSNPDILSTGEKQMINFARVMAIDADIIILDEVTSALSYETEMLVKNAIDEVTNGKIAFIIAHRLTTIKECDNIILMKDGKIVEEGKHMELVSNKREYYKLVSLYTKVGL